MNRNAETRAAYALVSQPGALRHSTQPAPPKRPTARRSPTAGNANQGSKWIRRERRMAIYARDGWFCIWCLACVASAEMLGEEGELGKAGDSECGARLATLDHFLCRARGGTNRNDNLLTCCMQCNHDRDHMSALEWATKLCAQWGPGPCAEIERARILERALAALDREVIKEKAIPQ